MLNPNLASKILMLEFRIISKAKAVNWGGVVQTQEIWTVLFWVTLWWRRKSKMLQCAKSSRLFASESPYCFMIIIFTHSRSVVLTWHVEHSSIKRKGKWRNNSSTAVTQMRGSSTWHVEHNSIKREASDVITPPRQLHKRGKVFGTSRKLFANLSPS